MLRKRLIGVVTVYQGWAVQSFGYKKYLPLGKPECLVENLDRWGADEIFIQEIDRSSRKLGPNFDLINRIAKINISTPLLYAGGVSSAKEAVAVVRSGVERVCVDALVHSDIQEVEKIAQALGGQAVITSVPLSVDTEGRVHWYDYLVKKDIPCPSKFIDFIDQQLISEVMVIDKKNEGSPDAFDERLLSYFSDINVHLIPFGGLSNPVQVKKLLQIPSVSAIAVGNFLNYKEHSVQNLKKELLTIPIRPAYYQTRRVI